MTERDTWGADPEVRRMRGIFAEIEKAQGDLLQGLKVSPSDYRLRRVREAALMLFEKAWMRAQQSGVVGNDAEIGILYAYCLARMLEANRIPVAVEFLPRHDAIARFAKEMVK